jgi:hypothetical protein
MQGRPCSLLMLSGASPERTYPTSLLLNHETSDHLLSLVKKPVTCLATKRIMIHLSRMNKSCFYFFLALIKGLRVDADLSATILYNMREFGPGGDDQVCDTFH